MYIYIYLFIIHVLHIHDYTWVTFHSYVKLPEGKSLLSGMNRISIKCHLSRNRQEESRGMGSTFIPLYIIRTKTKTTRFCSWYNSGMKKHVNPPGFNPHIKYHTPYNLAMSFFLGDPWSVQMILNAHWLFHFCQFIPMGAGKYHRIGWWENLQESPIFDGQNPWVSCRFSLKPIQWK